MMRAFTLALGIAKGAVVRLFTVAFGVACLSAICAGQNYSRAAARPVTASRPATAAPAPSLDQQIRRLDADIRQIDETFAALRATGSAGTPARAEVVPYRFAWTVSLGGYSWPYGAGGWSPWHGPSFFGHDNVARASRP